MIFYLYIFVIGLCVGSFLNVCIYRIPNKLSVVKPSSFCPKCKNKVKFYDNIPILSYFLLGGECRVCKNKISIRYPLVELVTGIIFFLIGFKYGLSLITIKYCFMVSVLVTLSMIDIDKQELPDILTFGLILITWLIEVTFGDNIELSLLGSAIYSLPFLLIYGYADAIIKREALGFGDVKLACGIGSILFYNNLLTVYIYFMLTFVIGSIISIILIKMGKKSRKDRIAFAPFMSLAAFVIIFL